MGGLTAPWLLFSRQGANGQGRRCWSRRWALCSTRPPTSASRPTITFPSVCGTTHPARTSGAAPSPMRSALYNFMVVNSEFLHRCMDTQMFFFHGFYNHSLELRRISFVWYSFWHSKTPHFLDSISYCLTNGVLFTSAGMHKSEKVTVINRNTRTLLILFIVTLLLWLYLIQQFKYIKHKHIICIAPTSVNFSTCTRSYTYEAT